MEIFVKRLVGGTLALRFANDSVTVRSVKQAVEEADGIPCDMQLLSHYGKQLGKDTFSLAEYGIDSGSTVSVFLKLCGGMQAAKPRLDFLNTKPPPNYVAGLGRGATGFTTRSDIGPARAAPDLPDRSATTIGGGASSSGAGRGRGKGGAEEEEEEDDPDDKPYDENQKFDEFEGNDVGLFATGEYDEDDKEADSIWESVDAVMDLRRKDRREARLKQEIEKYRASNPKITEQFADLKRKLVCLTADEWDSIPEVGDHSNRYKKRRFESFIPVPDTLLERAKQEKEHVTALDPRSRAAGAETPWSQTPVTDLTAVGEGRGTVLSLKLDRLSDSVSGLTVVDPKGYLTDLKSMKITSDAEVSDIKKARLLLKSVIQTNPKHPPGWIAAARLEEVAGKLQAARTLIQKGCEECPNNEDVWLEACRLAPPGSSKRVLAQAVKSIPTSVKLWLQASNLEQDNVAKSRVLRKALECIPDSVRLWRALVDLANKEDARVLLSRAVECCPVHVMFWLVLARLETYEKAKAVLNKARETLPTEPTIWITAAKLEEAKGKASGTNEGKIVGNVERIIERAIQTLQRLGVVVDREAWMHEAEDAERPSSFVFTFGAGEEISEQAVYVATCKAIIKYTIGIGIEEEDKKRTWIADADDFRKRDAIETARAIYAHALGVFPGKKSIWLKAAHLERSHGTRESLDSLLREAVKCCPQAEVLWLMGAKEKWIAGDIDGARRILSAANVAIPDSEEIWLAAFKLEFENREHERARILLEKAREQGGKERVWMKSAIVERELGNSAEEKRLLEGGLKLFPRFHKLWLMLGQLEERLGNLEAARCVYESALDKCPNSTPIWLSAAELAERSGGLSKARALLTMARLKNKNNADLWLAAIRAEVRGGNKKEAEAVMAKALQECRQSGILLAASIELAPGSQRRTKSFDAIKMNDRDPYVIAAVARLFWQERKVDKARKWLNRAVEIDSEIGDLWVMLYKFELQHGSEQEQLEVVERCKSAQPKYGERWTRIAKCVENAHLPVDTLLKKVVVAFGKDEGIVMGLHS